MSRDTSLYWVERDGKKVRLPSVTEVLKIAGFSDYPGVNAEVLENARRRGEAVHKYLESEDVLRLPGEEPPEEIRGYVDAYRRWRDDVGFEIEGNEAPVVAEKHGYAGTVDRWGVLTKYEPLPAVVDLKCTARLEPSVDPQLAGYEIGLDHPRRVDGPLGRLHRVAVQLKPDGTYRMETSFARPGREPTLKNAAYGDWFAALRVTHWRIRHGFVRLED